MDETDTDQLTRSALISVVIDAILKWWIPINASVVSNIPVFHFPVPVYTKWSKLDHSFHWSGKGNCGSLIFNQRYRNIERKNVRG